MSLNITISSKKTWNYSELGDWLNFTSGIISSVPEEDCFMDKWMNFTDADIIPDTFCDTTWDNFYCWPPTPLGTVIARNCSDIFPHAYSEFSVLLEGKVTRRCLLNGSWDYVTTSNYKECANSIKFHLNKAKEDNALLFIVQYMLFIGSTLSVVCLAVSLSIFYFYRRLRCDRVTVQSRLMWSLVFRFIFMFIIAEPHIFGHLNSYQDVDFLCESILVGFLYSTFSSVSWMFIQGLYLNFTLMAGLLNKISRYHLLLYTFIGWGVPGCFVAIYAVAMYLKNLDRCWNGYSEMDEIWILLCPITFEILMNGIFLMNILRILLRKIRYSNNRPDASQLKAATKATAILFPVLGVNNLVFLHNPGGEYNKFFVILNTFFASTQGIFVAIVYCFSNKDVWNAIRRSVEMARARREFQNEAQIEPNHRNPHSALVLLELVENKTTQAVMHSDDEIDTPR